MAMDFSGLFKSPEDIRGQRIDTLMAESMQRKQMPLLQQVAAGRGGMMAEGLAGMFGLKSPEEAKAEKNKESMAQVRAGNPESMLVAAERMREAGNVEGAFKLETMAQEILSSKAKSAEEARRWEAEFGLKKATHELAVKNFNWTTSEGWDFVDPEEINMPAGYVVQKNSKTGEVKTIYKPETTKGLELDNVTTVLGPNSESIRMGNDGNGNLWALGENGEPPRPMPKGWSPARQITQIDDPVAQSVAIDDQFKGAVGKDVALIDGIDQLNVGLLSTLNGNAEAAVQAERMFVQLTGDKQISVAELNRAAAAGALSTRAANWITNLVAGVPTEYSVEERIAFAKELRTHLRNKVSSEVDRYQNTVYSDATGPVKERIGAIADSYRERVKPKQLPNSAGLSDSAQLYLKQATGKGK